MRRKGGHFDPDFWRRESGQGRSVVKSDQTRMGARGGEAGLRRQVLQVKAALERALAAA